MTEVLRQRSRSGKLPRPTVELAKLFPCQGQWTDSEYLSLPEVNRVVELSNGRLVIPDLPSQPHQFAAFEVAVALRTFVKPAGLGLVLAAPMRVRLWPGKFREPDVVFMSQAHDDRRGHDYWGVPDLVVEVISPRTEHSSGTEAVDRKEKFEEYAQAGVSEYWIVETTPSVEVYALTGETYRLVGRWGAGQQAVSQLLPGFAVDVSSLAEC